MAIGEFEGRQVGEPVMMTARELATLLRVSARQIWRMLSAGRLPQPVRLGGVVRWRVAEVEKWIGEGCPPPQARENTPRRN